MYSNLLINQLPQHTDSGMRIRTDFRESIKFELLMQDRTIEDDKKIRMILNLYYYRPEQITDIKKALEEVVWFYSGGDKKENTNRTAKNNNKKQIYSYEFDAEYIYSAFMQQYRIDLNSIKYLHWWKFRALFVNLNEDVMFSKIMQYRAIQLNTIKDNEMKKFYKKMKRLYALPDMRTEEEKEYDFGEAFS
jgi:hypothetical protein|uniref:Bacteriophage Gp15 protein n=1 Tax=Siphoviridae sp. ctqw35 TaxID=2826471 RepID=A0A8S5LZK7_9CAUD|nr:MAG TPA: hypothetical protein [Siphoviridae sp. ctqw35]